jgi:hypothetical protein
MFSKNMGHFMDTIWIVQGVHGYYFGTQKNEKWILGPHGQAIRVVV